MSLTRMHSLSKIQLDDGDEEEGGVLTSMVENLNSTVSKERIYG